MPVQAENLYRVIQVAIEPMPRMNIRISTNLAVTVNNETIRCGEGECASVLSEYGVYVRTMDPAPLKTRLRVSILLESCPLNAEAEVIYRTEDRGKSGGEPGMGLQFIEISSNDQQRIREFIKREITKSINVSV